jgi:hypothetical protein
MRIHKKFVGRPRGNRSFGKPIRRWKDDIEMNLKGKII